VDTLRTETMRRTLRAAVAQSTVTVFGTVDLIYPR